MPHWAHSGSRVGTRGMLVLLGGWGSGQINSTLERVDGPGVDPTGVLAVDVQAIDDPDIHVKTSLELVVTTPIYHPPDADGSGAGPDARDAFLGQGRVEYRGVREGRHPSPPYLAPSLT
ncbi:hypothetical protein BaRGS_00010803 [Batillaria attramentaria]|uniref:Uncharacterized protein n=1 Tax=Batillaria attramentaria TaxID=370345 RepID=A0ABD0LF42_9CAEN